MSIAQKWQEAAPNSKVVNTYGPTETTVTISYYDWDSQKSPAQCLNGIVPLGRLFDGHMGRVVREDGQEACAGEAGELCLSGPQVTKEYWRDPRQTAAHYVTFPDTGDIVWYKSGDLVREGEDGCLYYLGRTDNQVKIQGNRVELGAIDQVLREAAGVDLAVSMPLLVSAGNAGEVVAFICKIKELDEHRILEYCRNKLPKYMVPTKVYFIDEMPLNRNGKIDRLQLKQLLEKGK
ncbi:MAG: AMP-binding protein [Candidatus Omnitrophica bacterium]|nr:AMP-binding protein [Candidatus Omnitrophota bacterium]